MKAINHPSNLNNLFLIVCVLI